MLTRTRRPAKSFLFLTKMILAMLMLAGVGMLTGCETAGNGNAGSASLMPDDDDSSGDPSTRTVQSGPGTSSTPADDPSSSGGDTTQTSGTPPTGDHGGTAGTLPPTRDPLATTPPSQPSVDPAPPADGGKPTGGNDKDPFQVPDGTAEELVQYITDLDDYRFVGLTQEQQLGELRKLMQSRLAASDKVLAMDATPEQRHIAVDAKLEAMRVMVGLGAPGVEPELRKFAESLAKDQNAGISEKGQLALFQFDVDALEQGATEDPMAVANGIQAIVDNPASGDAAFYAARAACMSLARTGNMTQAAAAMKALGERYKNSDKEDLKTEAVGLLDASKVLGFQGAMMDVLTKKEGADKVLIDTARQMLVGEPGANEFQLLAQAAINVEYSGNLAAATELYDLMDQTYKDNADKELATLATEAVEKFQRRAGLIGKPLMIEGVSLDGKPLDWTSYKGKVVLVDFWATWCGPCLRELPNIKANYDKYHDQGFDVVGVNLDDERQDVDQFFATQQLPWQTVLAAPGQPSGFENVNAVNCGVEGIPFLVLIGKDGNVDALHVRGEELGEKLEKMLGGDGDMPSTPAPAPGATEDAAPGTSGDASPGAADAAAPPAPGDGAFVPTAGSDLVAGSAGDDEQAPFNPYIAPPGLSVEELIKYLERLQEKPNIIQMRPGFTTAVCDAADRIMAAEATDQQQAEAILVKLSYLHRDACLDDAKADAQLKEAVDKLAEENRPGLEKEIKFYQMERKAIEAEGLPLEKVPDALAELKEFFEKEKLTEKHLRIASKTVAAINRLEDGKEREKYFAQFGKLFAKSSDKQLAKYGEKLAKPPGEAKTQLERGTRID